MQELDIRGKNLWGLFCKWMDP